MWSAFEMEMDTNITALRCCLVDRDGMKWNEMNDKYGTKWEWNEMPIPILAFGYKHGMTTLFPLNCLVVH